MDLSLQRLFSSPIPNKYVLEVFHLHTVLINLLSIVFKVFDNSLTVTKCLSLRTPTRAPARPALCRRHEVSHVFAI